MAKDFWKGFAQTFNPMPAAQVIVEGIEKKADRKRKEDEERLAEQKKKQAELEAIRERTNALANFNRGGETTLTEAPDVFKNKPGFGLKINQNRIEIPETKTKFRPYTNEESIEQGLKAGLTINEILNRINPKDKYDKFIEKPYQQLGRNKFSGEYEVIKQFKEINPAYEPNYIETPINPGGSMDKKTGKLRIDFGNYDPETGMFQKNPEGENIIRRSQYVAVSEKNKNGDKVFSKTLNNIYDGYFKTQQNLLAQYNTIKNGGVPIDTNGKPIMMRVKLEDESGNIKWETLPIDSKTLKKWLDTFNLEYANHVKNTASEEFLNFYKQMYNSKSDTKTAAGNPSPKDYWTNLNKAHKEGLSDLDFQSGVELFRATYGQDPLLKYGVPD